MKRSLTLNGAASVALWLLPALVAAESGLHSGAGTAEVGARARLDFKIVIPNVLALSVLELRAPAAALGTVRITSNGRQVSLSAAPAFAGSPEFAPPAAPAGASSRVAAVVLRAPRRGVIEQSADCAVGRPRLVPTPLHRPAAAVLDLAP